MNKSYWNEVAKYGLLLGIVMGASKIFEQTLVLSGNLTYMSWIVVEWLLIAVLYFSILYKATKKRALSLDPALGFSFFQGVGYMSLISMFAAVPISCLYYVYINSIVGYDNYIDSLVTVLTSVVESQPMDNQTVSMVEMLVDQIGSQPQVSIFETLYGTVVQYAFLGVVAGLILAGFIARKPEIFKKSDEQ